MRFLITITIIVTAGLCFSQADAAPSRDGKELYAQLCADCHGALESTDKPDRPAGRIVSAIRTFPSMASLSDLDSESIDAIVKALQQQDS